jgi:hypothetical protein
VAMSPRSTMTPGLSTASVDSCNAFHLLSI